MRSKRKWMRRIIIALMLLGLVFPQNVHAIDKMDESRPVSLSIDFRGKGKNLEGTDVFLYKVADVEGFGEFELTEDFANYSIELEDLDAEDYRSLAETLEIYVLRDEIEPDDYAQVGESGVVTFPANKSEMSKGLYLVIYQKYLSEEEMYTYESLLICLPNRGVNDEWIYDETIYPKETPDESTTELQVVKIWKDDGNKKSRPEFIEVELLKDGEVYESVKLNEENDWRYEWNNLEKGYDWKVAEKKVPEGYTVKVTKDKTAYIITNTYKTPEPPGTPPNLPQTGVLWWPVPILALVGMVFFMIGWMKRRRFGE